MLFEKLVKQHRVHCFIAHRIGFSIGVVNDEVGIYLGNLLGNQTKLRRCVLVDFVMKTDRFQSQDRLAGFIYRFNVGLVTPRRTGGAQLSSGVDEDWNGICVLRCYAANVANEAGARDVRTSDASVA